ncbi:MAG: integration host factor subunit beta [Alistipes sp.]|nr:integration host factor subunit beta [Alistipes sp.]
MTKADIVSAIANKTGIEKVQIQTVVEAFMEEIKESLGNRESVYLRGFGSFIVKTRAEKVGRIISRDTSVTTAITIPAHDIPAFKPSKVFLAKVK